MIGRIYICIYSLFLQWSRTRMNIISFLSIINKEIIQMEIKILYVFDDLKQEVI